MTAPERRRPLPALAFIAALSVLTALVWFRVLHRNDGTGVAGATALCSTLSPSSPSSGDPSFGDPRSGSPRSGSPSSGSPSTSPTPALRKSLPPPSKVTVLVLNSTQRNGIATATKKTLEKQGFTVTQAADDLKAFGGHGLIKGVAEIRYAPRARAGATLLRYYFPTAVMKVNRSSSNAVVTVSLGAKFTKPATSAAVRKAAAKDHLRIGTAKAKKPSAGASPHC